MCLNLDPELCLKSLYKETRDGGGPSGPTDKILFPRAVECHSELVAECSGNHLVV